MPLKQGFDKQKQNCENDSDMLERNLTLKSKRLTLRPFAEEDYSAAREMFLDPKIFATYMIPDFPDEEAIKKLFTSFKNASLKPEHFVYAISDENGFVGFLNYTTKNGDEIEIGYAISSRHWGKGYATEAFKLAIDELFRIGYRKIRAGHFQENPASRRVMEKAGLSPIELVETISYRGSDHVVNYLEIVRK